MVKDIVILGVGYPDILQILDEINQDKKNYNILGFIDDNIKLKNTVKFDLPILGGMDWLKNKSKIYVVNTIAKNMFIRKKVIDKLLKITSNFTNIIHPSVNTKYLKMGNGNIISKNTYFEVNSSIGSHCMCLPNVTVGHDVSIGDNCFFGPNSSILGGVTIKENVLIGAGSIILPKVRVSKNVVLGINSSVYSNVKEGSTVMTTPAREVFKSNLHNED